MIAIPSTPAKPTVAQRRRMGRRGFPSATDPSPAEIAERSAAIREKWSRAQFARAIGLHVDDLPRDPEEATWTPPEFSSRIFDGRLENAIE